MSECYYCKKFIRSPDGRKNPQCKAKMAMKQVGLSIDSVVSLFEICSSFDKNPKFVE